MPGSLISEHHLGACSGVKVNAVTSVVIAEPPMVVPGKSDLGIKMELVASYLFVICQAVPPTQQLLSYSFRGCLKPRLHLGTAISSFFYWHDLETLHELDVPTRMGRRHCNIHMNAWKIYREVNLSQLCQTL